MNAEISRGPDHAEDVVVTLSHGGYFKRQPLADYRAQRRGGRGKQATAMKDDDFVDRLFVANTHDYMLCFSSRGRVYWLKVYEVPQGSRDQPRQADRQPLPARRRREDHRGAAGQGVRREHFVFMATPGHGQEDPAVGRSRNPRKAGIIAVDLDEGDT
jgi:DNA gyrase subunit A